MSALKVCPRTWTTCRKPPGCSLSQSTIFIRFPPSAFDAAVAKEASRFLAAAAADLLERGHRGRGALSVVLAEISRDADGADQLSFLEKRQTAFDGPGSFEPQDPQVLGALCERVLQDLGRALEERGRARFGDGDGGAAELRVVGLLVIDQRAGGIDDGHDHEPTVLAPPGGGHG